MVIVVDYDNDIIFAEILPSMKRIQIEIRKSAVLEMVSVKSAYLARTMNREDVAVVDSDSSLTDPLWLEGVTLLSDMLMEWLIEDTGHGGLEPPYNTGDCRVTLDMPGNYPIAAVAALESSIASYLAAYIVWKWVLLKAPDMAQMCEQQLALHQEAVGRALMARDTPPPPLVTRHGRRGNVGTIVLYVDSLLHDIRERAHGIGDVTTEEGHNRHQTMDIADGRNEGQTLRDIDLAWHELEDILFPYLLHDDGDAIEHGPRIGFGPDVFGTPVGGDHGFGGTGREGYDVWFGPVPHWHRHWPPREGGKDYGTVDNAMPMQDAYEARLLLPEGVAESTVRYWRTLLHELIVTQVLANWCGVVNPDKYEALSLKVAQMREQLAVSLSCRTKRVRRPMRPW